VAFRWPNKDPDEILDYSVDWSRYLGSATITNVSWFVDNADGVKTAIDPTICSKRNTKCRSNYFWQRLQL
jgi:hypothetical protein